MKTILSIVACLLALTGVLAEESCYQDVSLQCTQASNELGLKHCNSIYGEFDRHSVAIEMQAYANLHLERSYEYLLSAAYFNNYQTNREGFSKLFKKLSDQTWEKTIDIIKHITKRGGEMNFSQRSKQQTPERRNYTVELHELESLAKALDTQKEIAERAFYIHKEATRNSQHLHDPEISQYLEEEFIEDHAQTIRNLAGHITDLKSFVTANNGLDKSLAFYLFDEYLQKTL